MLFAASAPPLFEELAILVVAGSLVAYVSARVGTVPIVGFLLSGALNEFAKAAPGYTQALIDKTRVGIEMLRETMLITSVSASTAQIDEHTSGSSASSERGPISSRVTPR